MRQLPQTEKTRPVERGRAVGLVAALSASGCFVWSSPMPERVHTRTREPALSGRSQPRGRVMRIRGTAAAVKE